MGVPTTLYCVGSPLLTSAVLLALIAAGCSREAGEPPAGGTGAPATSSAAPAAPASATEPLEPEVRDPITDATVTASSTLPPFDTAGLFRASNPGWHSQNPAMFPEWLQVRFAEGRPIARISLLPQYQNGGRAPARFEIQTSADGRAWTTATTVENGCDGEPGRWRTFPLPSAVMTRWLRLLITDNCSDEPLLTLRGLRVE
jgi:hypothetical protein